MTGTAAANHPPTCRACHGTGWTMQPCTHHWTDDDPDPEPLISLDEYLARHPNDHALRHARDRHPTARTQRD